MANIKSQKKRNLTNAKAAERNKAVKSELKTRTKTAVTHDRHRRQRRSRAPRRQAPRHGRASKGVIHKNQAARRKSRLMKKVNAAG